MNAFCIQNLRGILFFVFLWTSGSSVGLAESEKSVEAPPPMRWWFPEDISAQGHKMDSLFALMTFLTVPLLLLVTVFLVYCMIRFRRREGCTASYLTGFRSPWSMVLLLGLLTIMELPFDFYQEKIWAETRKHPPDRKKALVVQVFPEQFAWNFRYPGRDGRFGTPDDVTTLNELYVPLGRPVIAVMRAKDVLHSFFLPHLRVKQDVVPGLTTRVWFTAIKEGEYEIACAELCGLGHYRMRGSLVVQDADSVEKWLEEQRALYGVDVTKWSFWTGGAND